MARPRKTSLPDENLLAAALEGLQLQKQRIEEQIRQVRAMLGGRRGRAAVGALPLAATAIASAAPKKRNLSPAARKRIAAAQKKRWANYRKREGGEGSAS